MLARQALEKVPIPPHTCIPNLHCVAAEPINVGWGKKETQFHGSLGKAAAKSKQEVVVCVIVFALLNCVCFPKSSDTSVFCDSNNSHVSWRGDGQYFICSTFNSDAGIVNL